MKYLLPFGLILFFNFSSAQSVLKFEKDTYDFGEIAEEGGYAETTFEFINEGDKPVKIYNVKASCGCTTPGWSKEEIMPGDTGFVKARYNPRNRPGRFRKSLNIKSSGGQRTVYIMGFVKPKARDVLEEFSIATGDLRMKYRSLNLGRMTTETMIEKDFDVYNSGNDSLQLYPQSMEIPAHIQLSLIPEKLAPKQKGIIKIMFDPIKKNDLGFLSDNITIQTDSIVTEKNQFNVISTIEEFFPEMSAEELDKSPKLLISERVFDFGKVKSGDLVVAEFTLTNGGKEKLNFRKIKSNCSCVTYEIKSSNIKKGKSQVLKLTFDTSGRRGNQYKTISIFSNDPTAPTQMITIKGTLQKAEENNN
jgi:hypothetical protein